MTDEQQSDEADGVDESDSSTEQPALPPQKASDASVDDTSVPPRESLSANEDVTLSPGTLLPGTLTGDTIHSEDATLAPVPAAGGVDQALRQSFEQAWINQQPRGIASCLPPEESESFLPTLVELVGIDLEFQWKQRSQRTSEHETIRDELANPPLVEDYLKDFSDLNTPEIMLSLLQQEFWVRTRFSEEPEIEEYHERFPDFEINGASLTATDLALTVGSREEIERARSDDGKDGNQPDGSSERVRYFGEYELLEEIARGGMGVVYKARQTKLNRIVALKMILAGQLASQDDVQRFYIEAEAAANLEHPGIVPIHEIGEHEDQHFFSMSFIEGDSLDARVKEGPMPPREAAAITQQISEAIAYAHAQGVIHRDLKPANILIDATGDSKVTDFGLAKQTEGDSGLTVTGQILGTPGYMPPEQASGETDTIGPAADIYSLGAILYALLTGRPPFQSATVMDTLVAMLEQEPVAPRQLNPALDQDLETICLKCLQKDAGRRYATADELVAELGRYLNGEPIHARPIGKLERGWRWCKRKPAVAGLCALAVVMLLTLGIAGPLVAMQQSELRTEAEQAQQDAQQQTVAAKSAKQQADQNAKKANRSRIQAENAQFALQDEKERTLARVYATTTSLAYQRWLTNDIVGAEKLLDSTPTRFREWEFDYLKGIFHTELMTLPGHTGAVEEVRYSMDGKRIVSIQDGLIHVWDAGTGTAPKRTPTNSHEGYFSVSSNGQWFASNPTPNLNKILIVPILNGGESIAISGEEGQRYLPVEFSHNGNHLLTYDFNPKDGSFRFDVWDLPSRKRIQTLEFSGAGKPLSEGSPRPGVPAALSPDGKQVAFRAQDGSLVIHDVPSGKERHRLPNFVPSNDIDSIVTFSSDGRRLAASDADGGIWVHDVSTGDRLAVLHGHAGKIYGLSFSPDGRQLVSGGADMSVRLWDVASMRQIHIYRGHKAGATYGVLGVAFSPDGRRLVSSGYDMVVKVWDASFGEPTSTETADNNTSLATEFSVDRRTSVEYLTLSGHQRSIEALSVSPDGTRAATASLDGTVQIVDLNTNERLLTFTGHDGVNGRDAMVGAVAFSPDGRLVASGSGGSGRLGVTSKPGYILLWNSADGQLVHTLVGHKFPISQLQFTPDGKRLVSSSGNPSRPLDVRAEQPGEIMVWEVASGKQLLNFSGVESPVMALAVSPDATTVATGHWKYNSGIQVWDLASGQRLYSLGTSVVGFVSVEYSPDGTLLAGGGTNWEVALWDVAKRTELWNQKSHGGGVFEVTFTGNGSRLISASEDRTLKIWNPQTGDDLLTLNDGDTVYRADISSDGRFLVSAGESGKIRVRKAAKDQATETDQWPIMLADDFERDELGGRWTVQLGSCSIEEGVLKYELEKGSFGLDMTFAQLRLNDLLLPSTVDVSFDFWTPHELNCAANFHDEAETLGVSGMFMGKGHVLWNSGETGATVLAFHGGMPESINTNSNFSIEPDRRYRFRILREPTRVRLFVDGEEIISGQMLRMPGHVFIVQALCGQAGDVAYLDNLKIRAPQSTASELKALSLVEILHDDLPVKSIVIDRIQNDKSLSDSDKQQALEIVAIRKQEDPADAVDLIWKRLVSSRDGPGIVQSFLRYAEERAQSAPESVDTLRILAIAQLRSRDARAALQTLAIHEQRYRTEFGHADAVTSSLFALAHHQLKNESDVHRYIAQVDDLLRSRFFAGDADARQLAEQARKLVSASHAAGDEDRTAIRDITFLPQQALETGHDLDAWRKQWAEDTRIVRGRGEKPGPYDVVRTLRQEIAFHELESRAPPPMADRLVRDAFHIEIKDNSAEVRQEIVSGGIRPGTEGQHPGFDRRGYLLELTKLASGWAITAQREWGIESKNGLQAAFESQITLYNETLWAERDNKVTEVRKSNDSKSLRKALFQAARFHEALQVKPGESEITDGKYWAHQVLLARNLEDVQNLQNAVERLVEIQPATPPFLPILRDVSARKNLSEKPTSFKHGIRLRLPTYVTMGKPADVRLPGETCGVWTTDRSSVAGIYVTEFEEPQSADDLLKNADIEELFKAMGATILSKRAQSVGTYPSVSYVIEGMGHGNGIDPNGSLLTRGRWVLVPHGKQVFYFLFVSPAIAADALNAEFEVILQTLSFGKDKPLAVAQPMSSLNALKQIGLAMHNHHAAYRALPGNIVSEDGKPLLSWRVAILPFIEQLPLYQQFHLDEPWDSEHNIKLVDKMPPIYGHPELQTKPNTTVYQRPRGDELIMNSDKGMSFRSITDGTAMTILTVEALPTEAVAWTKPMDLNVDMNKPTAGMVDDTRAGFNVLMAHGAVKFISNNVDPDLLKALLTRNGAEAIDGQF